MQIHELNNYSGSLGDAYLAADNGSDTGKMKTTSLTDPLNARIDNIIAGTAPSAAEIVDARLGADGVTYSSLGAAIRDQVTDLKSDLVKCATTNEKHCIIKAIDNFGVTNGKISNLNGLHSIVIDTKIVSNINLSVEYYGNRFYVNGVNDLSVGNTDVTIIYDSNDTVLKNRSYNIDVEVSQYDYVIACIDYKTTEFSIASATAVERVDGIFKINGREFLTDNVFPIKSVEIITTNNICGEGNKIISLDDVNSFYFECKPNTNYKVTVNGAHNRFFAFGTTSIPLPNVSATLEYNSGDESERDFDSIEINSKTYNYLIFTIAYKNQNDRTIEVIENYGSPYTIRGVELLTKEEFENINDNLEQNIYKEKTFIKTVTTADGIISLYDTLMSEHTDYVSKSDLGTDAQVNHIYEYTFGNGAINDYSEHHRPSDAEENKPTILLLTGIHGIERSCVMGTYLFCKALCEKDIFSKIRNKYIIKVIPISVPSGYNANTYLNSNGVNIDCNFDFNWSKGAGGNPNGEAPADQLETQILQKWLENNTDALVMINYHNSGYTEEISYMSGDSSHLATETFKKKYFDAMYRIEDYLKQTYPKDNAIYSYTGYYDWPTAYNYANKVGLVGLLLEASWNVKNGGANNDSTSNKANAEILGNLILEYFD